MCNWRVFIKVGFVVLCFETISWGGKEKSVDEINHIVPIIGRGGNVSILPKNVDVATVNIFFKYSEGGTNRPCVLESLSLVPVQRKKNRIFESCATFQLGRRKEGRGAICLQFGVVSPRYHGKNGDALLIMGEEYKILSPEFGGYAQFRVPDHLKSGTEVRCIFIVNRGKKPEVKRPPKILIYGDVFDKHSGLRDEFEVLYMGSKTKRRWSSRIENHKFSLSIPPDELGGELLIIKNQQAGWAYKPVVDKKGPFHFPKDADRVLNASNEVSCLIKGNGNVENMKWVKEINVFSSKKSALPFYVKKINAHASEGFFASQGVSLKMCPGTYWLRVYGAKPKKAFKKGAINEGVFGEGKIEVKKERKSNVFIITLNKK